MLKFGGIERIAFDEGNPLLLTAPFNPFSIPFPVNLPANGTVNLALINIVGAHRCHGVLLSAKVNWSATFTPADVTTLNVPGFADVIFELSRNGVVIYRVGQTIVQKVLPLVQPTFQFDETTSSFEVASLLYFDPTPVFCNTGMGFSDSNLYILSATNINLVNPQVTVIPAITTAAVGAITLVANKVKACRD